MAKDDYHVIVYRVLSYLYDCLKVGYKTNIDYLYKDVMNVPKRYCEYIMAHLYNDEFIEGVAFINTTGEQKAVLNYDFAITPKGIEYLEDNAGYCIGFGM